MGRRRRYEFAAAGTARDSAPFFGIWFCGGLDQPLPDPTSALSRYSTAANDGGVARAAVRGRCP
jgi:hypothetical protein